MHFPEIQTAYIKMNSKLAGPSIIIFGILVSLWTNCIAYSAFFSRSYLRNEAEVYIMFCQIITHMTFSFGANSAVKYGLETKQAVFLLPWLSVKAIEGLFLFIGAIMNAVDGRNVGLAPLAIILLMLTGYMYLCVYQCYKKLKNNPQPSATPEVIEDKPPLYDHFINESQNI